MEQIEKLNTRDFVQEFLRRHQDSGTPLRGIFELTARCNLNCKMCYIHTKSNEMFLRDEHDGDWWIARIDEACKGGMVFAILTGGECLLHPDFRRIYSHLRAKGVYTTIKTNGILLNQNTIDFLKENPPFQIEMTLYGTDDHSYEAVTGVRAFRRAEETILRLKDSGLNFKIVVTPNPYAPNETLRLVEYLKGLYVSYSINAALFTPYNDDEEQTLSDNEVDVSEKIAFYRAMRDEEPVPIPIEELPPVGGGQMEPVYGMRCAGSRVAFTLTWDGYIQGCNLLHHCRVPVMDAVDFATAWEKVKEIGAKFVRPVECEKCAYLEACLSCPILRGGKVGNGHCDPAVCEMTRSLVAKGIKKISPMRNNNGV